MKPNQTVRMAIKPSSLCLTIKVKLGETFSEKYEAHPIMLIVFLSRNSHKVQLATWKAMYGLRASVGANVREGGREREGERE